MRAQEMKHWVGGPDRGLYSPTWGVSVPPAGGETGRGVRFGDWSASRSRETKLGALFSPLKKLCLFIRRKEFKIFARRLGIFAEELEPGHRWGSGQLGSSKKGFPSLWRSPNALYSRRHGSH